MCTDAASTELGELKHQTTSKSKEVDTTVLPSVKESEVNQTALGSTPVSLNENENENDSASSTNETKPYENHRSLSIAEIYSTYEKAMAEKDYERVKYLLEDTIYLITTDHGGQTEFLDLMSRFLMGPALNLIFSRLTDPLDKAFKIYCTDEDGISTDKEDSIVTLEEVLFQTLASIASMEMDQNTPYKILSEESSDNVDIPACSSKAMFVGTFRDQVTTEQFEKRDHLLKEKIEQTEFYHQNIVEYASEEHLTLDLNNLSGDHEEIAMARVTFEKSIRNNFGKVHIPCTWLMLSINIRAENRCTMTMDECKKMATTLGIKSIDLPNVLRFLHYRVGILLYYPDVKGFENIIICDIQVFLR